MKTVKTVNTAGLNGQDVLSRVEEAAETEQQ